MKNQERSKNTYLSVDLEATAELFEALSAQIDSRCNALDQRVGSALLAVGRIEQLCAKAMPNKPLPPQHAPKAPSIRPYLALVFACIGLVVLGWLYAGAAVERSRFRDSDTKYQYVRLRKGIDSVELGRLEHLFIDPDLTAQRAELEAEIDRINKR